MDGSQTNKENDCNNEAEGVDNEDEATTTDHDASNRQPSVRKNETNRRNNIINNELDDEEMVEILRIKKQVMDNAVTFRKPGNGTRHVDLRRTRKRLFAAAQANDQITIDSICKEIDRCGGSLIHDDLRDAQDKKTALHQALLNRCMKAADTLVKHGGPKLLFKNYKVRVQSLNSKMTCMHILCENGDTEWVKRVLNELEFKTKKDDFLRKMVLKKVETHRIRNFSCLHLAAINGHSDTVELLIKKGKMDVNLRNMKNETPFLWAVRFNRTNTMKLLISLGADVNLQNDKGTSPLHWAVKYNNIEAADILCKDPNIDVQSRKPISQEKPVHLACALDRKEIMEKFIKGGASVTTRSSIDGSSCLHFAANEGHLETVLMLLKLPGCEINCTNFKGDTPLQLASRSKKLKVVKELLNNGAIISITNKCNETVWDTAIQDEDNFLFSILVAHCVERNISLECSREPLLHIAARCGDLQKTEKLCELGLDMDERDSSGNTFFHIAARCNHVQILEKFTERVDINAVNQDGDTAAHVACSQGHLESLQFLISSLNAAFTSSLDYQNILHVAFQSQRTSDHLVKYCIEMTRSALSWDMVNHQDIQGNTPLHICVQKDRQQLIRYMADFDCSIQNNEGNTPAMIAAKEKNMECLRTILDTYKSSINLEQVDGKGNNLLHLLAEQGEFVMIGHIIDLGGDISLQNHEGNTILHLLAQSYVKDQEKINSYLKVVDVLNEKSVTWWCVTKSKPVPPEDSLAYREAKMESIDYLRSSIFNENGHSALLYTAILGAKLLLAKIILMEGVYISKNGQNDVIDITGFTPDTLLETSESKSIKQSTCCLKMNKIGKMERDRREANEHGDSNPSRSASLLETIVHVRPLPVANDMLNIIPLKQIVDNYWSMYQWLYAILLIAHVIYMSLLTAYGLNTLEDKHDQETSMNNTSSVVQYDISIVLSAYFITYPTLMTLFFACFYYVGTWTRGPKTLSWHTIWHTIRGVFQTVIGLVHLSSLLAWLLPVAFDAFVVEINVNFALATALLVGWLQTIVFTNGFQSVHDLSNVLLHMFFQDIVRFFVFYAVILLAFSTAFRALFLLSDEITPDHPDIWSVMFGTFNIMFDSGDLLVEDIDGKYDRAGHSIMYLKVLYVAYVISTAAVLLNILIAMLNSTYSSVQEVERSAWKVETIDLAMQVENIFPCIPKLFRLVGLKGKGISYDTKSRRWFITVPNTDQRQQTTKSNEISIDKRVQNLEEVLVQMSAVLNLQSEQLAKILDMVDKKKERKDRRHKRDI